MRKSCLLQPRLQSEAEGEAELPPRLQSEAEGEAELPLLLMRHLMPLSCRLRLEAEVAEAEQDVLVLQGQGRSHQDHMGAPNVDLPRRAAKEDASLGLKVAPMVTPPVLMEKS